LLVSTVIGKQTKPAVDETIILNRAIVWLSIPSARGPIERRLNLEGSLRTLIERRFKDHDGFGSRD
jgi:hypothetical protein